MQRERASRLLLHTSPTPLNTLFIPGGTGRKRGTPAPVGCVSLRLFSDLERRKDFTQFVPFGEGLTGEGRKKAEGSTWRRKERRRKREEEGRREKALLCVPPRHRQGPRGGLF